MKILSFFLFFWVIFALLDPDPDPTAQINADPCGSGYGSGSETLLLWVIFALLDPDPDPATQINLDPCGSGYGSGSETVIILNGTKSVFIIGSVSVTWHWVQIYKSWFFFKNNYL